jgi:hypothetical protein
MKKNPKEISINKVASKDCVVAELEKNVKWNLKLNFILLLAVLIRSQPKKKTATITVVAA